MNGKFIILLVVCMNIVGLLISFGYSQTSDQTIIVGDYIFETFFGEINQSEINQDGTVGLNSQSQAAVNELSQEPSAGFISTVTNFISVGWDVIKMTAALLSILTPFPLIAFFNSLGIPLWVNMIFSIPLVLLYILSIAEFVRGGQL